MQLHVNRFSKSLRYWHQTESPDHPDSKTTSLPSAPPDIPESKDPHGQVSGCNLQLLIMVREVQFPGCAGMPRYSGSSCFSYRLSANPIHMCFLTLEDINWLLSQIFSDFFGVNWTSSWHLCLQTKYYSGVPSFITAPSTFCSAKFRYCFLFCSL